MTLRDMITDRIPVVEASLAKAKALAEEEGCLQGTCSAGDRCYTEFLINSYTEELERMQAAVT